MPGTVIENRILAGLFGKVPARGDFVRSGLPRDFTDPWDDWLQVVIAGSRARMGDDWLPAYLESPIWRFTLSPRVCGARAVMGVLLPSVDRAGRYFPLTFAVLGDAAGFDIRDPWLDRAEEAGRAALESDALPEALIAMLGPLPAVSPQAENSTDCQWWTEGSPRVPESHLVLSGLPDIITYASMLGAPTDGLSTREGDQTADDVSGERPS